MRRFCMHELGVAFLNDASLEFANKTGLPEGTRTQDVDTTVSKYDPSATANDWLSIKGVWYDVSGSVAAGNYQELPGTSEAELATIDSGWKIRTGTPISYMMVDGNTKLQLWPTPDTDVTNGLQTRYTRKPTLLDATNLGAYSDIPDQFQEALCWKAASVALFKYSEDQRAAYYEKKWAGWLEEGKWSKGHMDSRRVWRRGGMNSGGGLWLDAGAAGRMRIY